MMLPKITFGIIVLNGEPFTRYNLRALYPFAHEIIVVEGAAPAAASISTPDGHSIDGTLATLYRFKSQEDPENKITIITAEDEGYPNGFWPGEKHEQSQAYAKRATGDWLWQVDIDEFYQPDDMQWICKELLSDPDIYAISFEPIQFWGGLDYYVDGWYLRYGENIFHRVFRWRSGYQYVSHRPPTVVDEQGIALRQRGWAKPEKLIKRGIYLYHYATLFPEQVRLKSNYYSKVDWGRFERMVEWADENYIRLRNPYRVHKVYRYPSWLERYSGTHPPQVLAMWSDIQSNRLNVPVSLRDNTDVERLLSTHWYWLAKLVLKLVSPVGWWVLGIPTRIYLALPAFIRFRIKSLLRRRSVRMLNLVWGARFGNDR